MKVQLQITAMISDDIKQILENIACSLSDISVNLKAIAEQTDQSEAANIANELASDINSLSSILPKEQSHV